MIKFSLLCGRGHEFESWFQSGEAFETQSKSGRVSCPLCQATDVTKAIMAPAIASKSEGTLAKPPAPAEAQANRRRLHKQKDMRKWRSLIPGIWNRGP